MQTQPQSRDTKTGRDLRVGQAARDSDDTFEGGGESSTRRLGLRPPWMMGTSRLFNSPQTGASEE